MTPLEADWTTEHVEQRLRSCGNPRQAVCEPLPLSTLEGPPRWAFVVLTDLPRDAVRCALPGFQVLSAGRLHGCPAWIAGPLEP